MCNEEASTLKRRASDAVVAAAPGSADSSFWWSFSKRELGRELGERER